MPTIQQILEKFKEFHPQASTEIIEKAYRFAQEAHQGQKRLTGQDRIEHLLSTAYTLAQFKLDTPALAGGFLHDILEYTSITLEQIKKEFGDKIAFLVEGISQVEKIKYQDKNKEERQVENLRKIFLAMAKDIRVVLIKLADRLHNMKTLYALPKEEQKRIALETLEIYAPIAYRLGIRKISGELEDLAFPIVYPKEHQWLVSQVKDRYQEREKYLKKLVPIIEKELKKVGIILIEIHSRAKRYFSLYRKLQRYEMDLNKIYDLVALRIIVKDIDDCYAALGVIHKLWRPLPGRIKDYIALSKPNGYRSLHTTVFCPDGKITEFQIRTPEMHQESEYGIAAHWYYSEKKGLRAYIKRFFTKPPEKELKWIQQFQRWQEEVSAESEEFFQSLKIDFLKDRVFVFTPKGDVIDLPEGATPVDFAYHIHTDIGHRCSGAKADGKLISLDQSLVNGQIVEIITQKEKKPSQDWLRFVKTSQAKSKIKNWFKKTNQEIKAPLKEKLVRPLKIQKESHSLKRLISEIEIDGQSKILTHLARCCQPKPGQEIKGYITISRGISIHRVDCHNLTKIKNTERFISVNWKNDTLGF